MPGPLPPKKRRPKANAGKGTGRLGNPGWQKGVSGNPGGIKKEVRERAKELSLMCSAFSEEIIDIIVDIIVDPKTPLKIKLEGCRELLDRGYGRPPPLTDFQVNLDDDAHKPQIKIIVEGGLPDDQPDD